MEKKNGNRIYINNINVEVKRYSESPQNSNTYGYTAHTHLQGTFEGGRKAKHKLLSVYLKRTTLSQALWPEC